MPKLAEGYTAKYAFHCLEKNMTRFEAECAFQLEPEPLKVEDINQYIVMICNSHLKQIRQLHTKCVPSWDAFCIMESVPMAVSGSHDQEINYRFRPFRYSLALTPSNLLKVRAK